MLNSNSIRSGFGRASLWTLAAFAIWQLPAGASAGSLHIDPVKVEITAERKIGSVRIRNEGSAPVTIRGYAMIWAQEQGEDVYREATGVIVSPPVATIAPGATQLVRVGLRAAAAPASYRLIIEEVPEANPGSGIHVALRLNLPLYVMMDAGKPADLAWSSWQESDGRWVVEAVNKGSGYVRVEAPDLAAATGIAAGESTPPGTVLPASSRRWIVDAGSVIDRAKFQRIVRAKPDADAVQIASQR